MKVCPECQARFDGGEAFCPHDGAKLVDARELSPGEMTGLDLAGEVHLDRLEFSDGLAERYAAKLSTSSQPVRVSVFNQGSRPDASRRQTFADAVANLPGALPPEILSVQSVNLDEAPPFITEEAPRGPSLKSLLDERKALDWQVAIRLTCSLGRALEYLAAHGVVHAGIHPEAIFITNLQNGKIQLGEWAHDILCHPQQPLEMAGENPDVFLGYTGYLAPEVIRDASDADERSLVYAMGMLLYEMIAGKPPFTSKNPADALKRHLHEKPLKLSIARGAGDLPSTIDDILDMMLIKAAERRFQNPTAAISALSSLIDVAPTEVAPELAAADSPVFESTPDEATSSAVDNESADQAAEADEADAVISEDELAADGGADKKTIMGMPSVAVPETQDDDAATDEQASDDEENDESPSIIIDAPALQNDAESEDAESEDAESEDVEATTDESTDDDAVESTDSADKRTLMMGSLSDLEEDNGVESSEKADAGNEAPEKKEQREVATAKDEATASASDGTKPMGTVDDGWDEIADDVKPEEEDTPSIIIDDSVAGEPDGTGEDDEVHREADEADEADGADENDEADEDHNETNEAKPSKPKMNVDAVGFVEAENSDTGDFGDDWFSGGADDVWDKAAITEHHDRSENLRKYLTIGIIGFLVLGSIGLFFFFENYDGEAAEAEAAAESSDEADEADEVIDVAALRADFDEAFERGHLIRPLEGSAVALLEQLEKSAEDDAPAFEEARRAFVEAAEKKARAVEDQDLRFARDLSGYASQFAPDNTELKTYSDELHKRFVAGEGDAGDADHEEPNEAADNETEPENEEAPASVTDKEPKAEPSASQRDDQKEKVRRGTATSRSNEGAKKKPPARSFSQILRSAKAAANNNQNDKAIKLYREAISRSPSNPVAHAELGDLLFHKSAYSQAVKHHKKASSLNPGNVGYAISLGRTYYRLGRYQAAHDAWERALKRDPDNKVAKKYLTLVKRKL